MGKRILIVEDSQVLAMAYSLPFVRKGYRVEIVGDGRQALQLVRSFQPDVVLLDLVLPKVRGSVILEALRSSTATENLPVVVFTSSLLLPNEEVRMRRLANRFLHKAQTSPEQMLGIVEELLTSTPDASPNGEGSAPLSPPSVETPSPTPEPAPRLAEKETLMPSPSAELVAEPVHKELKPGSPPALVSLQPPPPVQKAPPPPVQPKPPPPVEDKAPVVPEPIRSAEAAAPVTADAAPILQELESHTRRLLMEQSEDAQGEMLVKIVERLRRLDEILPAATAGAFGRLLKVFESLAANLVENRKNRTPSATRTLLQACPILQRLFKDAQTARGFWEPPLAKILVVDDSVVSLKSTARALEAIQLECAAVADPLEAIALISANSFDLVVLDVDMPQMTGTDLCKKLRTLPQHAKTPVIFLTSLNRFDIRVTTTRAGGDDVVSKPFLAPELAVKTLTHMFRRHLDAAQPRVE
ncbi:MAG: response regulator [Verrucomicrobia bacterium]|nr:response regulator [Verrucomicrobiota bacterium]